MSIPNHVLIQGYLNLNCTENNSWEVVYNI